MYRKNIQTSNKYTLVPKKHVHSRLVIFRKIISVNSESNVQIKKTE